ncbi:MAG TPA: bis-aminopropyl spermidine synthase family protein [Verrucomicrobiae bacterium]|nr:bis-aminopropyl spermidine synthase family protein [Verrucomicrobiae bacterium]
MALDLRKALNTVSDVVQNRPAPLREFDQIYMKVADMVIQAEFIARTFDNKDVVFVGDGDSIGLSVMHLKAKGVIDYAPSHIVLLDFDERIVNAVNEFAEKNELEEKITAVLYNVCDPLPQENFRSHDAFYTNPPWGASNDGQSVTAFIQRGIEAIKPKGMGAVVIADDDELDWPRQVVYSTQKKFVEMGFIVCEMIPNLHKYHLDDAPELMSCSIVVRDVLGGSVPPSEPLPAKTLINFYGRDNPLKVRYVRDLSGLNRGRAADVTYKLIPLEKKL